MITTSNLVKRYGGRKVLENITFDAPDGMITGLLGANGAGKTTTLRMICGALRPDAGSVVVDDEAGDVKSKQERIGALLDHAGLYSRLSARENLAYFGRLRGIPTLELEERVQHLIEILGLGAVADLRTAGFSQGERMKTALGRALLHFPQNLLLDEPTNGLDIPSIRSLRDLLRRLRDQGTCIVYSSHVLDEVRALCDRVVIIANGRIVAQGAPSELCDQTETSSLEDAFIELTCAERRN